VAGGLLRPGRDGPHPILVVGRLGGPSMSGVSSRPPAFLNTNLTHPKHSTDPRLDVAFLLESVVVPQITRHRRRAGRWMNAEFMMRNKG